MLSIISSRPPSVSCAEFLTGGAGFVVVLLVTLTVLSVHPLRDAAGHANHQPDQPDQPDHPDQPDDARHATAALGPGADATFPPAAEDDGLRSTDPEITTGPDPATTTFVPLGIEIDAAADVPFLGGDSGSVAETRYQASVGVVVPYDRGESRVLASLDTGYRTLSVTDPSGAPPIADDSLDLIENSLEVTIPGRATHRWGYLFQATLDSSLQTGANVGRSFTGSALAALTWIESERFTLSVGVIVNIRFGGVVLPLPTLALDWTIDPDWSLEVRGPRIDLRVNLPGSVRLLGQDTEPWFFFLNARFEQDYTRLNAEHPTTGGSLSRLTVPLSLGVRFQPFPLLRAELRIGSSLFTQ